MATFQTYLQIGTEKLPVKRDDYSITYEDVLAESSGTTEAGTNIRDVIREGVPTIKVNMDLSYSWVKKLREFKRKEVLTVSYFDFVNSPSTPATGKFVMTDFKASLAGDSSTGSMWQVSFTLEDMSDV